MTLYAQCMTMLSVRVDDDVAARIDGWCTEHDTGRSEFVREAVRRELNRRLAIDEATRIGDSHDPDAKATDALMAIQDWGPHEDWSAWHDWLDKRDAADTESRSSSSTHGDADASR